MAGVLQDLDVAENVVLVHFLQRHEINFGRFVEQLLGGRVQKIIETICLVNGVFRFRIIQSLCEKEKKTHTISDQVKQESVMLDCVSTNLFDWYTFGQTAQIRCWWQPLQIQWHR